jgi:hypothetical protein
VSSELEELTTRCAALQSIAVMHCALKHFLGQAAAFEAVLREHPLDAPLFLEPTVGLPEIVGYSHYWRYAIRRRAEWLGANYHYTFEVVPFV